MYRWLPDRYDKYHWYFIYLYILHNEKNSHCWSAYSLSCGMLHFGTSDHCMVWWSPIVTKVQMALVAAILIFIQTSKRIWMQYNVRKTIRTFCHVQYCTLWPLMTAWCDLWSWPLNTGHGAVAYRKWSAHVGGETLTHARDVFAFMMFHINKIDDSPFTGAHNKIDDSPFTGAHRVCHRIRWNILT